MGNFGEMIEARLDGKTFGDLEAAEPSLKKLTVYRTNKSTIEAALNAGLSLTDDKGKPMSKKALTAAVKLKTKANE